MVGGQDPCQFSDRSRHYLGQGILARRGGHLHPACLAYPDVVAPSGGHCHLSSPITCGLRALQCWPQPGAGDATGVARGHPPLFARGKGPAALQWKQPQDALLAHTAHLSCLDAAVLAAYATHPCGPRRRTAAARSGRTSCAPARRQGFAAYAPARRQGFAANPRRPLHEGPTCAGLKARGPVSPAQPLPKRFRHINATWPPGCPPRRTIFLCRKYSSVAATSGSNRPVPLSPSPALRLRAFRGDGLLGPTA